MKKLKLKALELGASEVLTRAQLKNVLGGSSGSGGTSGGTCYIKITGGPNEGNYQLWPPDGSCSSHSTAANNFCLEHMDGGRCSYDCDCDGIGN